MPVVIKAVVTLPHVSGLPRDADQNTFIFSGDVDRATTLAAIADPLVDFYVDVAPGASAKVASYLSGAIDRSSNACSISYTEITSHLDGSVAGSPFQVDHFTMPGPITDPSLPAECSVVMTLFGTGRDTAPVLGPVSTIPTDRRAQNEGAPATHSGKTHPKQSRTGRLYLGPLNRTASDNATTEVFLSGSVLYDLSKAAVELNTTLGTNAHWVVWSRKLAATYSITGGYIDNAFDTQRRRGPKATTRQAW